VYISVSDCKSEDKILWCYEHTERMAKHNGQNDHYQTVTGNWYKRETTSAVRRNSCDGGKESKGRGLE
jgi:hypothetical protein